MSPNTKSEKPQNPNEFLQIPKWINEDYFRPIVEKDVSNFASIVNFTPVAATQPGENYTSIMVRVYVDVLLKDGSQEQVSYILKTMLESSVGSEMVNDMGLFPKEKKMYEVHIPQFMKLYKEAGVDNIELAPKCVHIEETPERTTLVLEDLTRQGFKNVDRLKGFDMPHIRRVLHKLAEFHAASARNFELNGPYDEIFLSSIYTEKSKPIFINIGKMRTPQFHAAIRSWNIPEEDAERYIKQMSTEEAAFEGAIKVAKVDENEFNVLNHGDSWSNNYMFNYKANREINRSIFVDLQMCKWGSPAQDLWYMLVTSASLDIKVKEFDRFIQIYHERLVECLKVLKYGKHIPTLKELHIMMLKYGYWGPLTSYGVLVATIFPSDKDANINMMLAPGPEGDAMRQKTFSNPYYARAMEQLLPFFESRGLLKPE
ncbi:uncharacterized protein Dwil_GK14333 [Drosophila willistoni]|uniref:CHK kinase-like domain-containing protein n=1 Tax=Drosophila willistoni TaxID=7260 RepID=B4NIK7_DROWI|nr:uncharacterized protein LOC6650994 [Drosophila willistoni]XP_023035882.1 uncharacterized protein LOC6650994 [Drosophila willistoni]EDW84830.1 uncharacterized protein Dwil_GK14333 [Drosophila willistoni]